MIFEEKNGIKPENCVEIYKDILEKCREIDLVGLMTIGSLDASTNLNEPNRDFKVI